MPLAVRRINPPEADKTRGKGSLKNKKVKE
jgi:hypothetical protein